MKATAKELRTRTKEVLDAVDRGETVTVTYRGEARAQLVPVPKRARKTKGSEASPLFGIWADRDDLSDVEAYVDHLRRPRRR
ncbi:MAG: type II toxin-antitoxin system prevent-host-death family antitoxin [Myxococcota bacterium]